MGARLLYAEGQTDTQTQQHFSQYGKFVLKLIWSKSLQN
jgi:hypothetical protein